MDRIRSIKLHPALFVRRVNLGRILVVVVKIALALLIVASIGFGVHQLVIHNGPSPTCAFIPNPPQHDCFWPGPERREFSVDYVTPHGVRSLVWFGLPAR